ncbi:SET domain-containing protein 9-like [Ostrea edulis]|uniref:SET domain-containing protein 9-like n=1 Tax=Ostrea edulis TaxID=37623 RepID=UPI0020959CEC|nr:SET domain-containing protein 9-like [Ostrea edulis]
MMSKVFYKFKQKWAQYRYRFVPWIALTLNKRSARTVNKGHRDKLIPDEAVHISILDLFERFHQFYPADEKVCLSAAYRALGDRNPAHIAKHNLLVTEKHLGFKVEKRRSTLPHGGMGVFVTSGRVPPGAVVSFYPGTVYYPHEAILFQSIGNPFILRCIDGVLIDGNDRSLSKMIFNSCSQRDRRGPFYTCDSSWLTDFPQNPLAIGQYVNNHTKEFPANVVYQEFEVPVGFPFHLKQFIPNVFYSSQITEDPASPLRCLRLVVLVSIREIQAGEELFSSYFTVVC